jgi:UPF0755 protein
MIEIDNQPKTIKKYRALIVFIIMSLLVSVFVYLLSPTVKKSVVVNIGRGESLKEISESLEKAGVVRSAPLLQTIVLLFQSGRGISIGDYEFNGEFIWRVAYRLANGIKNTSQVRVTIPEGFTNEDIATLLSDKIKDFDKELFLSEVKDRQGFLFPDTYFFYPHTKQSEIIDTLDSNFNKKMKTIEKDISESGKSLEDIIIMASILQGEAKGEGDIYIISGVLWKRMRIGMPLQVDVYRGTYEKRGLPSAPISNPGMMAIKAAIYPQESKYLYYIHDKKGDTYFAASFDDHKKNIRKYLR